MSRELVKELTDEFESHLEAKDLLDVLTHVFDYLDENEDFQKLVKVEEKVLFARRFLESVIRRIFANSQSLREKYLQLVDSLFVDSFDIGSLVGVVMTIVNEISRFRAMDNLEKKRVAKMVFDKVIDFSELTDDQKCFARQAFGGIVELAIWAKHGGLKKASQKCKLLCGGNQ